MAVGEPDRLFKEKELTRQKGFSVYTLAGQVATQDIRNELIRSLAKVISWSDNNDGIVEVQSALPEWSARQQPLVGYDHFEMSRGNENDSGILLDDELFVRVLDLLDRMRKGLAASGRITNQFTGAGIPGLTVDFDGLRAVTGADGWFEIPGAPPTSLTPFTISGAGIYARRSYATGGQSHWGVVPSGFPMFAFDDVAREFPLHGKTSRWTRNPRVYVDTRPHGFSGHSQLANWIEEIRQKAPAWIDYWSNGKTRVSDIDDGPTPPEDLEDGTIVIRFDRSIRDLDPDLVALTGKTSHPNGDLSAAVVQLYYEDRTVERDSQRRNSMLITAIGHMMGFGNRDRSGPATILHFLEWANHDAPTPFDEQSRTLLYDRTPGNSSPDTDLRENVLGDRSPLSTADQEQRVYRTSWLLSPAE